MTRVFLDSSVFFSAAYSPRGHARDLIMMALRGGIDMVLSRIVIEENRRNRAASAPEQLPFLGFVLESVSYEVARPTKEEVLSASKYTALKDAPIAAAAKAGKAEPLATLDRKHLLGSPELKELAGSDIVSPEEAVEKLRAREGE
ncbi:MAG: PIN domain-containing protein [Anaerolineales bacterium]|nr:PIN domain-containing protein [Anaerolineales bacterium]